MVATACSSIARRRWCPCRAARSRKTATPGPAPTVAPVPAKLSINARVSERALRPRADLLPDVTYLVPAKAAQPRKLVKATLLARGFTPEVTRGAEHTYVHSSGATVRVDFGPYMGQIRYSVSAACR
jgi:hypothetical protein